MQYLVTGEFIDPGPLPPPDQLAEMGRQMILPSHDVLLNLRAEGKLLAGGMRSERGPERRRTRAPKRDAQVASGWPQEGSQGTDRSARRTRIGSGRY